jgi:ABC-type uncharacterized transport system ATPase subunit
VLTGQQSRVSAGTVPFFKIDGLTRTFGGVRAVDSVDLTLNADEIRCVIGPNGCGKTTLFNLITGYLPPTSGRMFFEGQDLSGWSLHRIAKAGIVRKFQVPSIFAGLTVADNIVTALSVHRKGDIRFELDRLLTTARLSAHRTTLAGTLSHGQKQWLELALVLAATPRLVLLDEPTAGMTRAEKAETVRLVASVRRDAKLAVLIIEHDMEVVEALNCPVSVMITGRIVASGDFMGVRNNPTIRTAYFGSQRA